MSVYKSTAICVIALFVALSGSERVGGLDGADADDRGRNETKAKVLSGSERLTVPLPPTLPDGRQLRPIALFQSQLAELIPEHYRPITLERLSGAILGALDDTPEDQTSRLRSSVYWIKIVDGTLVSDRSTFDIETDREGIVRLSLGKINLATEGRQRRGTKNSLETLPRLESEPGGNLAVIFRASSNVRSGIEFKWRLRGQNVGSGHDYLMRVPRCPQTRIVLSVPSEFAVDCRDGVLHSRPGPPPDVGEFLADKNARWYEIDAGGLSSVRLRTRRRNQTDESDTLIVRRSSTQYEVDASGLTWNCRMVLQIPPSRDLPPVVIDKSVVTSVKINGVDATYSTNPINDHQQQVLIDVADESYAMESGSTTVTLTGKGLWDPKSGWCDLPIPVWIGDQVVRASPLHDIQLAVPDTLQVLSWELPAGWRQIPSQTIAGATVYVAEGPPASGVSFDSAASLSPPQTGSDSLSRVRLANLSAVFASETLLLLDLSMGQLHAAARMSVNINPDHVNPVRLQLQSGWSLQSVTLPGSGREIEISELRQSNRSLVVWPEPSDVVDSTLVIEATGVRGKLVVSRVPATWFVRAGVVRGAMTAAVIAPPKLDWSGNTAMKIDRIERSSLTELQQEFFSAITDESLLFHPQAGRTPALNLQSPSVSFDVTTVLQLRRDGSDLVESLVVDVDAASQVLPNLTVQTGSPSGRPPYQWFLQSIGDSPPISLPSSDVVIGDGEYTIDLLDRNMRDRQLVARRRYPIDRDLPIQLPSVPKAASQSSEVHLGGGLIVKRSSPSVLKIPVPGTTDAVEPAADRNSNSTRRSALAVASTRLRYDAVRQPTIVVAKSDENPNVTIVWQSSIRVVASSRGADRVEATYKVSAAGPVQIDYDEELHLVSVYRDGESIDLSTISQRPIVLDQRSETETIRVVWNRNQLGTNWFRRCRMPRAVVSGVKVRSVHHLIASSDAFAPVALMQTPKVGSDQPIAMSPGGVTILVRRNIALAMGWLLAAIVFTASWYVSRRKPAAMGVAVALLVTAAYLWWPWHLAIIGWMIVPATAAALLVVATAWSDRGSRLLPLGDSAYDDVSPSDRLGRTPASHLSATRSARALGWLIACSGFLAADGIAADGAEQEVGSESEKRRLSEANSVNSVNVLIPVDPEGSLSGDVVYIPSSVYADLFSSKAAGIPQEASFQSASYRINLDPSRESADKNSPLVQADFLIHVADDSRSTNFVRLPISVTDVRRIELLGELNRIVQFDADPSGNVITKLPPGTAFELRLTMIPAVSRSGKWDKIFLSIPPIASSRVTIEADQNMTAVRVGGPAGRLLDEQDLRRWVEEIGPADSLEVEYQRPDRNTTAASRPLERRYWLNIAMDQATIDCEITPPNDSTLGQTVQLVIRNARLPILTTKSWALRGSELVSSTRRLVTFESMSDSPGPISFLWTEAINGDDWQAGGGEYELDIPEVIAPAAGKNAEAWIAIDFDRDIRVAPTSRELTEPLSVDHFLASWSGYRGRNPRRALIAVDRLPVIKLEKEASTKTTVVQKHHLHVTADQLILHYSATLIPGSSDLAPRTIKFPSSLQLLKLTIAGKDIANRLVRSPRYNEVAIGDSYDSAAVSIEAHAVMQVPANKQFDIPQMAIMPAISTSDTYTLTRDREASVRIATSLPARQVEPAVSAAALVQGWIPVATWVLPAADSLPSAGASAMDRIRGRIRVFSQSARFDCRQLISLSWIDGEWNMEAFVRFQSGRIPDFIDVEVPTRWCELLEVSPANAWSRQPAIDPSRQIVRIECDAETLRGKALSIRGRLDDAEHGRVAVPNLKVLGRGRRSVEISVPRRLTNETIRWRTSVVEAVKMNPVWNGDMGAHGERATYSVANPDWSVELAPLPQVDIDAVAVTSDARVFSQSDGTLVICRWDVIPGGLDSVSIKLPVGAKCLGAWTAGRAVLTQPSDSGNAEDDRRDSSNVIEVPLSLSRLSQPVEVLVRVPIARARQADYLPKLLNIPVPQSWLATFVATATLGDSSPLDVPLKSQRALALATSIVESVEQSLDSLAERPKDEIAIWLAPWIVRYRQLAASVNHTAELDDSSPVRLSTDSASAGVPVSQSASIDIQQLTASLAWAELDSRLSLHVSGRLPTEPIGEPLLSLSVADGYALNRVMKLSATNHAPPIEPPSFDDQGLRTIIVNCLTLMLVGGLLACLWPVRHSIDKIVVHPAFWLGLIGVLGLVVAPVPVAAAILLVAITLPVFPRLPRRASRRDNGGGRESTHT